MRRNFIFGYGSLISKESRSATGQTGEAMPVRVQGIERAWILVKPGIATALGVMRNPSDCCNGVIVPVPEEELPKFDAREGPEYSRIRFQKTSFTPLRGTEIPEALFWAFITNKPGEPSEKEPLIQSYIDVVLAGCLEFGESFAREFIATTKGWDAPWINDRNNPRYPRALKDMSRTTYFDSLLKSLVPEAFGKRR